MVTDNHYRWDFIGLSTDEKPTPATSPKVVDGSTFYCSDNSKLYVYCKDQWYEKTATGGGASYTAGDGITIADSTISVDTTTIQPKLTAGTNITITDNVISASGGETGLARVLTSADYNDPEANPTRVNLFLLPPGLYYIQDNATNLRFGISDVPYYEATLILLTRDSLTGAKIIQMIYPGSGDASMPAYVCNTVNSPATHFYLLNTFGIKNNLTTSSDNGRTVLSAYQGYVLKGLIDALDGRITALGG